MKRTSVGRPPTGGTPVLRGHGSAPGDSCPVYRPERPLPLGRLPLDRRRPRPFRRRRYEPRLSRRAFAGTALHLTAHTGRGQNGLRLWLRSGGEPGRSGRGPHGQRRGRHGRPAHSPEDPRRSRTRHQRGFRDSAATPGPLRNSGAAPARDAVHPPNPPQQGLSHPISRRQSPRRSIAGTASA
jgi:hypothetical protein